MEAYERSIEDKLRPNHGKVQLENDDDVDAGSDSQDNDMIDEEVKDDSKKDGTTTAAGNEDDWASMSDEDSDSDSDSDSEEDNGKHKKKNKKLNPKANSVGLSKKMLELEKRKDFFKDM